MSVWMRCDEPDCAAETEAGWDYGGVEPEDLSLDWITYPGHYCPDHAEAHRPAPSKPTGFGATLATMYGPAIEADLRRSAEFAKKFRGEPA